MGRLTDKEKLENLKARAKEKRVQKQQARQVDGLGPHAKTRLRSAIRDVWHGSYARKLAAERCIGKDGFPRCEQCGRKVPKVTIDHMVPVGEVDDGFIRRMFCSSDRLKALCGPCHSVKTKADNASLRKKQRAAEAARGFW